MSSIHRATEVRLCVGVGVSVDVGAGVDVDLVTRFDLTRICQDRVYYSGSGSRTLRSGITFGAVYPNSGFLEPNQVPKEVQT